MRLRSVFLAVVLLFSVPAMAEVPAKKEPVKKAEPAPRPAKRSYPYVIKDKEVISAMIGKLKKAYQKIRRVRSYTMIMTKQQRVKGSLKPRETMFVKFKKPFNVYMKWLTGKNKGREVLYVKGWNDGKIRVRERGGVAGFFSGLVGAVNLKPTSSLAMRGNLYPITELGFEETLKKLINNIKNYKKRKDKVTITHEGFKRFGGVKTTCIRLKVPNNPKAGYFAYITRICMNFKRAVMGEVKCWNWKKQLREHYTYRSVRLGAGLTSKDFDPKNKKYKF